MKAKLKYEEITGEHIRHIAQLVRDGSDQTPAANALAEFVKGVEPLTNKQVTALIAAINEIAFTLMDVKSAAIHFKTADDAKRAASELRKTDAIVYPVTNVRTVMTISKTTIAHLEAIAKQYDATYQTSK